MDDFRCYFEKGQYYFGYEPVREREIPAEHIIAYDDYVYAALCDTFTAGLVFLKRDGKYGVFTMQSCGMGGYGGSVYASNIFPFLYDEILLNGSFSGDCVGYVAVRINHYWGILRVQDHMVDNKRKARRPCMMIVPCIYHSKEDAIAQIHSNDYNPKYGWHNPFDNKGEDHRYHDYN